MSSPTEMTRTDAGGALPRWLSLTIASLATLIGVGVLWSLAPADIGCFVAYDYDPGILPGPQPCCDGGRGAALASAGILVTLLAAMFVIQFTVVRRRGLVTLIVAGVMLLVLVVGVLATVAAGQTPVVYY